MKRLLVDARSLQCPLPLLKLKQGLAQIEMGDEVEVTATDVGSWRDIPAYIALTSHELLEQKQNETEYSYIVKKGE